LHLFCYNLFAIFNAVSRCGFAPIPKKVAIKNASHTIKKGNGVYQGTISDYFEIYYEVTFDEFPEKNNYYLAKITQIKTGYYGYYETEIDYIDPVFKEQDAILDESMAFNGLEKRGGALFTDQSINGQTYGSVDFVAGIVFERNKVSGWSGFRGLFSVFHCMVSMY
jgi:hypothetical protein